MNNTPQPADRQDILSDRIRATLPYFVALLVFLATVTWMNITHPQPPAGQWAPQPDPPMVDNSVTVKILSDNQVFSNNCFGSCR